MLMIAFPASAALLGVNTWSLLSPFLIQKTGTALIAGTSGDTLGTSGNTWAAGWFTNLNASNSMSVGTSTVSENTTTIQAVSTTDTFEAYNASGTSQFIIKANNFVGVGTSTPSSQFQVATTTASATTTITIGRGGQGKGSCLELYNTAGTVEYAYIVGTTWTVSATSCK